ncbi:sensor histidine kinase [Rosettibacter firmus]|uniref:sensor histidine kinase n=1 Tax=Rosettibacter firmus TaxID=3111522 RepID=UPI00336BE3CA
MKNIRYEISYIKNYIFPFIISNLLFLFIAYFTDLNITQILLIIFLIVITFILMIYFSFRKREQDFRIIINTIKSIRKNQFNSPDEIRLPEDLFQIEKEIHKMYRKIENDISHLKKLEKIRTEFLGNVSHELRTPIFAIQGYIETLLNGAIDDKKVNRTFLEKANQHVNNLNNLLNDLIDISMIESKQMRMSLRFFKIAPFLENIVYEFKPYAEKKNLELVLLPFNNNIEVYGDKERLKQVMNNLITNAIKYTETGKVEIGVVEFNKSVKIFVKDTGIGIPEKDLDRIFERFYRVDKNRSREMGGTGLGLAIVKHIIEAHNSKVEVKSQPGKGSEFSFVLKKL